jgi:hypothetical protein
MRLDWTISALVHAGIQDKQQILSTWLLLEGNYDHSLSKK